MTLWKMAAVGVRLADELSRPVHPAAYALVTATPVTLRQRERLDPAFRLRRHNGA
jgi:hypothetical protein